MNPFAKPIQAKPSPLPPPSYGFIDPFYGRDLLVVCPELADPTNLCAIIRSAAALGSDGILNVSACAAIALHQLSKQAKL